MTSAVMDRCQLSSYPLLSSSFSHPGNPSPSPSPLSCSKIHPFHCEMHAHVFTTSLPHSRFYLSPNSTFFPLISLSIPTFLLFFPNSYATARATPTTVHLLASEPAALTFYELLGIPESGSLLEIKHAYRQLARKFHPDVSPPGQVGKYTRAFLRVQEAYETLSDPKRRALYDRDMAGGIRLAFSAQRRCYNTQVTADKREWKNQWEAQLAEMKRIRMYKNAGGKASWGDRVRKQNEEQSHKTQP